MIAIPTIFGNHYVWIDDIQQLKPIPPGYLGTNSGWGDAKTEVIICDSDPVFSLISSDEIRALMND